MIWIKLGVIAFVILSSWVATVRLRRKMKKALGRDVSETELTSLNAWMEIADREQRKERDRGYTSSSMDR